MKNAVVVIAALLAIVPAAQAQKKGSKGPRAKARAVQTMAHGGAMNSGIFVTAELDKNCRDESESAPRVSIPATRPDVPLTVRSHSGGKVTVVARGAPARQVLFALSKNAEVPLWIHGPYAEFPIWTALTKVDAREAIHAVALAIGHATFSEKHGVHVLPSHTAGGWHRQVMGGASEMPVDRRVVKSANPRILAEALASLVLTCQGRAIALPSAGKVLVQDNKVGLALIDAFMAAMKTPPGQSKILNAGKRSSPTGGWKHVPHCRFSSSLKSGSAKDAAAKALFLAAAKNKKNVVLGCAGSVPSSVANTAKLKWEDLLTRTDFLALGDEKAGASNKGRMSVRLSAPKKMWVVTERAIVEGINESRAGVAEDKAASNASIRFIRSMSPRALAQSINGLGIARAVALPKSKVVAVRTGADQSWANIQNLSAFLNRK
jgi:hypothetical protein